MPRRRANRIEQFDQALEGQIGVPERRDVGPADLGEQRVERRARLDLGAQHQGVDEHADQIVEFGLAAAGHRGSDGDVRGARQPGQQHRERGVHHHEQCRIMPLGELFQLGMQVGVDVEGEGGPAIGRLGGPGPVDRQRQFVRQGRERAAPVLGLLRDEAVRVALGTEHLPLPQAVVRVLDRQRGHGRGFASAARLVGQHQIPGERSHRPTVGADVVRDEREHVLGRVVRVRGSDLEQFDPERDLGGHVEARGDDGGHRGGQIGRVDPCRSQTDRHLVRREHLLYRAVRRLRIDRAQDLVTRHQVRDGLSQSGHVQVAGEADGGRDVVDRGRGVELVEEPHALLRQRQRDAVRARSGDQGFTPAGARVLLDLRGESGHGGGLENHPHRDTSVQRRTDTRRHLRRQQRITTQREEIIIRTHTLDTQHLAIHRRHDLLDRSRRHTEHLNLELRLRQRPTIQLAVHIQRQSIQHHERRRHHVRRQHSSQLRLHPRHIETRTASDHSPSTANGHSPGSGTNVGIGIGPGIGIGIGIGIGTTIGPSHSTRRHQVSHQTITSLRIRLRNHRRLRDPRQRQQRRLDLTQLDTETTNLHLKIRTTPILQLTATVPGDQITRAIHPGSRLERVGHEPIRRQIRATEVTTRQLRTSQIQLTRNTHRNRTQTPIQDVDPAVPFGRTDRHRRLVGERHTVTGDRHRSLGRPIQVEQLGAWILAQEPLGQRPWQRLTDSQHPPQRIRHTRGQQRVQHGRHDVQRGDPFLGHEFVEVRRIPMTVRRSDDQTATTHCRRPELPHRQIERRRRLQQNRISRIETELDTLPLQLIRDRTVRKSNTLRTPRRTRRENHIRRVLRTQRPNPISINDRCGSNTRQIQLINTHHRRDIGIELRISVAQHTHRSRSLQYVTRTLSSLIRIHRHIRTTGLRHRIHRHDQIHRPTQRKSNPRLRTHTHRDQMPRKTIDSRIEFGVGQLDPLTVDRIGDERRGTRVRRHAGIEQRDQGRARIHGLLGGVPARQHVVPFGVGQQLEIADRGVRVRHHGRQDAGESRRETFYSGSIEKVGRVRQEPADTRRRTRLVIRITDDQMQIELRHIQIRVHTGHRQTWQLQRRPCDVLERQTHLEQRMTRRRPRRIQHLHQPLERHIRMRERRQIGFALPAEQADERLIGLEPRPEHHGIDEHADQVIELTLTTTRDGCADGDVVGARQPSQQHRERRMHHHEQRGAVDTSQIHEPRVGRGIDLDIHPRTGQRGHRRSGSVGRQLQQVWDTGELLTPEADLPGSDGCRIGLVSQHRPLPQRVIRVLHPQRRPPRGIARGTCRIGDHHIPHQRTHRRRIRRDVMHHHREHIRVGHSVDLDEHGPQRHLCRHVERSGRQGVDAARHVGLGQHPGSEVQLDLRGGQHHLHRTVRGLRIHRAQHLVPAHHVVQRRTQRGHIQRTGQPQGERQIVSRRTDLLPGILGLIEAVEEPHPPLCQRQRQLVGPGDTAQLHTTLAVCA
ncbi:hypothetical protein NG2371_07072 [Nocardia gamkensis]|nr:hypothetical protein [Nocardia gamkensis]